MPQPSPQSISSPMRPPSPSPEKSPSLSSSVTSPSYSSTINLSREYTLAIQTNSYKEIWSKLHCSAEAQGPAISNVLHPDKESIDTILQAVPATDMTRLISSYMDSSEHTSRHCLSLRESINNTRALYSPIGLLLNLIPSDSHLTPYLYDLAFDTFLQFDSTENPFPSPSSPSISSTNKTNQFEGMRSSFLELKQLLDLRLLKVRQKRRLLRRTTRGSGICLIGCTTGITIIGLVLATHAMAVMVAGSAFVLGGCGLFAMPRLKDDMDRLDAAARNTYVLNNDMYTIEKLVERLHATIESDKMLVKLVLGGGKGQRHNPIEHVVLHLRNNYHNLLRQLSDLDEHICIYFASVNRARSVLLQHICQPNS